MYILIDSSAGDQSYVEDCQICCQPMRVDFYCDEDDNIKVHVSSDN